MNHTTIYCRIALPLIVSFLLLMKVKTGSWSVERRRMVIPSWSLLGSSLPATIRISTSRFLNSLWLHSVKLIHNDYYHLQADTAKVIWAYHSLDPVSLQSLGRLRHERMGSTSLNLLGGSTSNGSSVQNTSAFIIANENVISQIF